MHKLVTRRLFRMQSITNLTSDVGRIYGACMYFGFRFFTGVIQNNPARCTRTVSGSSINWFPGHMQKGLKDIHHKLSAANVIIELHDARLPYTGRCSFVQEISQIRPYVLVLNKSDLADLVSYNELKRSLCSKAPFDSFQQPPVDVFFTNLKSPERQKKLLQSLLTCVARLAPSFDSPIEAAGEFANVTDDFNDNRHSTFTGKSCVTAMVVGLPNCGKSSLINALRSFSQTGRRKAVGVGKSAGRTRSVGGEVIIAPNFPLHSNEWGGIRECKISMIDTPGILEPHAKTLCGQLSLAVCGAVDWNSVDKELLADYLLFILNRRQCFNYVNVFGLPSPTDHVTELLAWISARFRLFRPPLSRRIIADLADSAALMGISDNNNPKNIEIASSNLPQPDLNAAAHHFLKVFCEGRLGRITFQPEDEESASRFFVLSIDREMRRD